MDKRVKCVFPNFIFFAFIFLIIKSALIFIFCIEIDRYMPTFWFWGPAHGSIWKFCKINDVLIIKKIFLEPVCCKKQQKKVPDQLVVCRIGDLWRTWMIPNWLHMSPSDSPDHPGSILNTPPIAEILCVKCPILAGLAVLFSRQLPNGTHNFQHNFLYHLIKNPQTTIALTFLTHNISGVGGVTSELLLTA